MTGPAGVQRHVVHTWPCVLLCDACAAVELPRRELALGLGLAVAGGPLIVLAIGLSSAAALASDLARMIPGGQANIELVLSVLPNVQWPLWWIVLGALLAARAARALLAPTLLAAQAAPWLCVVPLLPLAVAGLASGDYETARNEAWWGLPRIEASEPIRVPVGASPNVSTPAERAEQLRIGDVITIDVPLHGDERAHACDTRQDPRMARRVVLIARGDSGPEIARHCPEDFNAVLQWPRASLMPNVRQDESMPIRRLVTIAASDMDWERRPSSRKPVAESGGLRVAVGAYADAEQPHVSVEAGLLRYEVGLATPGGRVAEADLVALAARASARVTKVAFDPLRLAGRLSLLLLGALGALSLSAALAAQSALFRGS